MDEQERMEGGRRKSVWKAYVLWLFFGYMGGHHFYLERDVHAFLWCTSFGGFHIGFLRDVWRIPHYVVPSTSSSTMALVMGQIIMGTWYSIVFQYIPSPSEVSTLQTIVPININVYHVSRLMGQSLGIYLPGCASHLHCPFGIIFGSVLLSHYYFFFYPESHFVSLIVGILTFTWTKKQHNIPKQTKQSILWRWFKVYFCVILFWMAVVRSIYHHGTIHVLDPITNTMISQPISELVWTSPFLQQTIVQPIQYFYHHPFTSLHDFYYYTNPEERNAYRELEMNHCYTTTIHQKTCNVKHIKRQFYKLSKVYHPDKIRNQQHTTKQVHNEKMLRLNHAYELLLQRFKQQQ